MAVKYVLHPGYVRSQYDGQTHFISGKRLADLYRLPHHSYTIYPQDDVRRRQWRDPPGAIHLFPRSTGDYTLPEKP